MTTPNFNIFEDDATFDVIWRRLSDDEEEQTDPGEREYDGIFQLKRAPQQPASSSTTQNASIPMIASFTWEDSEAAEFSCDYNHTSRSYDHFALVEGSMSDDFATALLMANGVYTEPDLDEVDEGIWKLRMYTMYGGRNPQQVELWAKKRVDDVVATATDGYRRRPLQFEPWLLC